MIWRNAGRPYPVRPGFQFGSVDHQRSKRYGFRKHGNQMRIAARLRFERRDAPNEYDYLVSRFYID